MSGLFASPIGRLTAMSAGHGLSVIHANTLRCMGVIVACVLIVVLSNVRAFGWCPTLPGWLPCLVKG